MSSSGAKLPPHGLIECRSCWSDHPKEKEFLSSDEKFKLVNDPAAWGSTDPEILVLGMTKGNTQSDAIKEDDFDAVAFKDFRDRLTTVLKVVGVVGDKTNVSELIRRDEKRYGWGSVIRCSLTGFDKRKKIYTGESSRVIPAFGHIEMSRVVSACYKTYLSALPESLKLIVLLGNDERYMKRMKKLTRDFYPDDFFSDPLFANVAYRAGSKLWVHVGHPSKGNGYFNRFIEGAPDRGQGKKRELAKKAIASIK